jgi:hypothetical protein
MYTEEIDERMSTVEAVLGQFIVQTNRSLHILQREMKEFKDEMKEFKEEGRRDRAMMNKQWGDLANKLGTIVEDIVAPAVRPVMQSFFKEDISLLMVNVQKKDKSLGLQGEFDVIAVSNSFVFLVETKSSPKKEHITSLKNEVIPRFRKLFPEYDQLRLIPVFSSLRFNDDLVAFATENGIYMLAYKEWEYMDLLNFNDLKLT